MLNQKKQEKKMKSRRELILGAINHKDGAVPMCIRLTGEAHDRYDDALLKEYRDPAAADAFAEGIITKRDAVDISIGNCMADCPFPWWNWDYANVPEEYGNGLDVPSSMPPVKDFDGDQNRLFEKTRVMRDTFGLYTTALVWGSHWEKAFFVRGIENLLADIAGEPDFVKEFFGFIIEKNKDYLRRLLECPYYDGVLFGSDWGTQKDLIMSPESWREIILPGEKTEYDMTRESGKHVMVHSCGRIDKIMPDIASLGVDILNPVQPECTDIAFLKEKYGEKMTFWGGVSTQKVLPYGTPEEVKKETERTILLLGKGGGYITAPSQEIQDDVPFENLRAIIDTARYFAGF